MISENSGETDFSLSPQETVDSYVNTLRFYLKSEKQPNRDDFTVRNIVIFHGLHFTVCMILH